MKMTDGKKTVSIQMKSWYGNRWNPDCSPEFFDAPSLMYDEESDCSVVEDVDYCIDQAQDWKNCEGDYAEDAEYCSPDNRMVCVEEIV